MYENPYQAPQDQLEQSRALRQDDNPQPVSDPRALSTRVSPQHSLAFFEKILINSGDFAESPYGVVAAIPIVEPGDVAYQRGSARRNQ
jgi:hypothetical protein